MYLLGIDTGGTFTDFFYSNGQDLRIHKVLSTPHAPEQAIVKGIAEMGLALQCLQIVHGSTLATNAILEGKGAKTLYITNRGLKDVLTIGRQARSKLYDLQPEPSHIPVPEKFCLETGGRITAHGDVIEGLTAGDLETIQRKIRELKPDSVAVNLLFSFLDDRFEQQIAAILPDDLFISLSSQVLTEHKEYERGISTWLNAYVGPLLQAYLQRLVKQLEPAHLSVMRSSGDICNAEQAGREAVHLLLSGPAGGLTGAKHIADLTHNDCIMTFDMGGTSTDVALIDGAIRLHNLGKIADYPVGVPMVEMHTIGAGGGSIAYVDAGGGLHVGPGSVGAIPGPACYDMGGDQPTVTDANLLLGHMPEQAKLGGDLRLNPEKSRRVLQGLAKQLGLESAEAAAQGVIRIANEQMIQALRVISVERGIDPRDFMLVAFGGAGGMHVCALADALEIRRAMTPVYAGVLSALGMLAAPAGRQLSRTLGRLINEYDDDAINREITDLTIKGRQALREQGLENMDFIELASLDLCYHGQEFALNIPWHNVVLAEAQFHMAHEQRFGHRLDAPVELLNVRLSIRSGVANLSLPEFVPGDSSEPAFGKVYGFDKPAAIYQREQLTENKKLSGPVIVCDSVSTTYVAPGWNAELDGSRNLLLNRTE